MKTLFAGIACLLAATAAMVFAFAFVDHPGALGPQGTNLIAVAAVVFLCTGPAGFVLLLWWRDRRTRAMEASARAGRAALVPAQAGLSPGKIAPGATVTVATAAAATAKGPMATPQQGLAAGVYGLTPGTTYRVIQPIRDYYGGMFAVGEELTFEGYNFLPYHGGYTLRFKPRFMYFQEDANADVLNALDQYLAVADG